MNKAERWLSPWEFRLASTPPWVIKENVLIGDEEMLVSAQVRHSWDTAHSGKIWTKAEDVFHKATRKCDSVPLLGSALDGGGTQFWQRTEHWDVESEFVIYARNEKHLTKHFTLKVSCGWQPSIWGRHKLNFSLGECALTLCLKGLSQQYLL